MDDLSFVLEKYFDFKLDNCYFSLPAIVESFDRDKNKVDLKILFKKTIDKKTYDYPIVKNIPVLSLRTQQGYIYLTLEKGDGGLLVISDLELQDYLNSTLNTSIEETKTGHKFFNEAIFIPGLFSFSTGKKFKLEKGLELNYKNCYFTIKENQVDIKTEKTEITMDNSSIKLKTPSTKIIMDNKIYLGGTGSIYEVIDIICELFEMIFSSTNWIGNMGAPVQFLPIALAIQKLQMLKLKFKQFLKEGE